MDRRVRVVVQEDVFLTMDQFALHHQDKESGGLLLGRRRPLRSSGGYEISIEKFVELRRQEGVSRFSVDQRQWDQAQAEIKEQYGQLEVVGWMHTHPGFGAFLSGLDKEQHRRFFREPWALAYVVDPINVDRAFFCRYEDEWERVPGFYIRRSPAWGNGTTRQILGTASWQRACTIAVFVLLLVAVGLVGRYQWLQGDLPLEEESVPPIVEVRPTPSQPSPSAAGGSTDSAGEVRLPSLQFVEYRVESGDTLWELSRDFLGDPSRYRELMEINELAQPNDLRPGMVLRVPLQAQ